MSILSRAYSSRWGRAALGTAAGASMLLGAALPAAQAASLSTAQVSAITAMLSAFNVDTSVIANVQTILSGESVAAGSTTPSSTSAITAAMIGQLGLGTSGNSVCYLQALLAADSTIYPEGL